MSLLDTKLECVDGVTVHFAELLNEMDNDKAIILMVIHDVLAETFYMDFNISAVHTDADGYHHIHQGEIAHILAYVIDDLDGMLESLAEEGYVRRAEVGGEHFATINCAYLREMFGDKEV